MPRTIPTPIARIVLVCVSLGLTLLLIELGARAYHAIRGNAPEPEMLEFRLQRPPPYADAAYFSKEFVVESFTQPGGVDTPKGTRLVIPKDFSGKWFNTSGGLRVTTGQPASFRNTVYVIGGSTVYGGEVPDALTIPSQLQSLFNQHHGDRYRVANYGMTTVTSSQQLERLHTIKLRSRDIVIFYDGVNDVFQEIYYGRARETMVERNRRAMEEFSAFERFLVESSSYSTFVRNWINPINYVDIPAHLRDREELAALAHSLQGRYRERLLAAKKFATNRRARFFHFLQPNIYTLESPTVYEEEVRANPNLYAPPGMDIAFEVAYPLLEEVSRSLREDDRIDAYDLTKLFDGRERGVEHYLDICHVAHVANGLIASAMFDRIEQSLNSTGATR